MQDIPVPPSHGTSVVELLEALVNDVGGLVGVRDMLSLPVPLG